MEAQAEAPLAPTQSIGRQADSESLQILVASYYAGALTCNMLVLGDRLGLFKALGELGPCTPDALGERLSLSSRYLAEWCRQVASSKMISCDDEGSTFWLTEAQKDVLVREHGPDASPFFGLGAPFSHIDIPNSFHSKF